MYVVENEPSAFLNASCKLRLASSAFSHSSSSFAFSFSCFSINFFHSFSFSAIRTFHSSSFFSHFLRSSASFLARRFRHSSSRFSSLLRSLPDNCVPSLSLSSKLFSRFRGMGDVGDAAFSSLESSNDNCDPPILLVEPNCIAHCYCNYLVQMWSKIWSNHLVIFWGKLHVNRDSKGKDIFWLLLWSRRRIHGGDVIKSFVTL